ncbi:SDR family oxidoreductase [Actinoplanes sp. NPDC051411]|uniref:SDR family oxidoreductase n=1 Tax=Actinoplanes sp. NPDC051411 TaxID=3155522 RepID=UPI0034320817
MSLPSDLDLRGRRALVTGASGGLGLELAARLAGAGAEVLLAVRDEVKGEAALEHVRGTVRDADVSLRTLDLASLKSVAELGDRLSAEDRPIHLLVNNGGVMTPATRHLTADGLELQFGTNYVGHFALTLRLLPLLSRGRARVTTVTSSAARTAKLDWADLQGERKYRAVKAYGQSKLADLLFALELDRRSRAEGWGIVSNAAHPGTTLTGLYAAGPNLGRDRPAPHEALMTRLARWGVFVHHVGPGALPILYAAAAPLAVGGRLYGPDGFGQFTGGPAELVVYRAAKDEGQAAKLWDFTMGITR